MTKRVQKVKSYTRAIEPKKPPVKKPPEKKPTIAYRYLGGK